MFVYAHDKYILQQGMFAGFARTAFESCFRKLKLEGSFIYFCPRPYVTAFALLAGEIKTGGKGKYRSI